MRLTDLTGRRVGRWTVLGRSASVKKETMWECICDCGTRRAVSARSLRRGVSLSCGCLCAEVNAAHATKHGMVNSPEWRSWASMRGRCNNPNSTDFAMYGGRGVRVAAEWDDFAAFLRHVGPRPSPQHSLNRIDNDGHYGPGNVEWATPRRQARNRRSNRLLTHAGLTLTVAEWAEHTGLSPDCICARLDVLGWGVADALTRPPGPQSKGRRAS